MKTSLDIPDWLVEEVRALNPEVPLGQLLRDGLLISLPEWRRSAKRSPLERALRMRLRIETTRSALEAAKVERAAAEAAKARRPRAAPKPRPDASRAGRKPAAPRSPTKAAKPSPPPGTQPS